MPLATALLLALLTASYYAELVTKYPKAGGAALFAERAFKRPALSFMVGFCMLAAGVTSAAGLALAFTGDYLSVFLDVPPVPAAVVFLLLVALLNARGISESVRTNVVMTVIELSGLILVIVLVAVMVGRGDGYTEQITRFPADSTRQRRYWQPHCSPTTPLWALRFRPMLPKRSGTSAGCIRGRCSGRCSPPEWCIF